MKLSSFLAGSAAAALALAGPYGVVAQLSAEFGDTSRCGDYLVTRKEVHDMTQAEWTTYMTTIQRAMVTPYRPDSPITLWERFADIHNKNQGIIHGNSIFVIWHRWFVYYVERELRKLNPNFFMPYWATERQYDARSWAWDGLWGVEGQAMGAGKDISGGAFAGAKFTVTNKETGSWMQIFKDAHLKRAYALKEVQNSNSENVLSKFRFASLDDYNNIFNMCTNRDDGFHCWANRNEWLHGTFHVIQGGNEVQYGQMATMYSPLDPLFYLHHTNIDRIYDDVQGGWAQLGKSVEWQTTGSCPTGLERNDENQSPKCLSTGTKLPGFGLNVGDTLFLSQLCVRYEKPVRGAPAPVVQKRRKNRRAAPAPAPAAPKVDVNVDIDLKKNGTTAGEPAKPKVEVTLPDYNGTGNSTNANSTLPIPIKTPNTFPPLTYDLDADSDGTSPSSYPTVNITLPPLPSGISPSSSSPLPSYLPLPPDYTPVSETTPLNSTIGLNSTLPTNGTSNPYPTGYIPPTYPAAPLPAWWIQMQYANNPDDDEKYVETITKQVDTIFKDTTEKVLKGEVIAGPHLDLPIVGGGNVASDLPIGGIITPKKKCQKKEGSIKDQSPAPSSSPSTTPGSTDVPVLSGSTTLYARAGVVGLMGTLAAMFASI